MLSYNPWVKDTVSGDTQKYTEASENENTICQNLGHNECGAEREI